MGEELVVCVFFLTCTLCKNALNFDFFSEMKSEAVKILKGEYLLKAICELKMDQAIIFCRTKLDCDNVEKYLLAKSGSMLPSLACFTVQT